LRDYKGDGRLIVYEEPSSEYEFELELPTVDAGFLGRRTFDVSGIPRRRFAGRLDDFQDTKRFQELGFPGAVTPISITIETTENDTVVVRRTWIAATDRLHVMGKFGGGREIILGTIDATRSNVYKRFVTIEVGGAPIPFPFRLVFKHGREGLIF